jgi:uncharacterized membrane protein
MDEIALFIVALLLAAAFFLGLPIAIVVLFTRTRMLARRVSELQDALAFREMRERQPVPAPASPAAAAAPPPLSAPAPAAPPAPLAASAPPPAAPDSRPAPALTTHPPASAPADPVLPVTLEERIGSRWLLYIGVVAIVIGAAYFEKLAIDYGWIGEGARVIQGAVVGLALIAAGLQFTRRGYPFYGQVMAGGGGAILYLSTYAAFNFYALIERPTAFTLMVAITGLVAWLADRQRSQGLAFFAVGGGFATPFLLPGTTDAQIALFTYDAILIGGTAVLAHRRQWPFVNLVSYVFALLTVAAWADRFYTPAKYLRTEIYLTIDCAMFLDIAVRCRRAATDAGKVVWLMLCTAPLVYYLASLAILGDHDTALLAWLVMLMLAGGVAANRVGPGAGLVVWAAAAVPLVIWCSIPAAQGLRREGLIALTAVYTVALLAELEGTVLRDEPRPMRGADIAWVHLNPLVLYAGVYVLLFPLSIDTTGRVAAGFALWNAAIAAALWSRRTDLAVHFLAVAFSLLAIAVGLLFNGTAVTAGWAVEGALVIILAIRQRLAWLRGAGVLLFAIAVVQAIELQLSPAPASQILLLNPRAACAALIVGLCYVIAWFEWRDPEIPSRATGIAAALLTAQFVTLVALTGEVNAFWAVRNAYLARELSLSVAWGLYGTALVVVGLARGYPPIRYFAIGVLALTIAKVFAVDMSQLDRIYRVGSIVVLGVLLLLTSYLYSRSRKAIDDLNGRV